VKRDLRVQWQLFLGVAAFIAVIDIVYWFVSYEEAGTTMLTLAAALAAFCGVWLFVQDHRRPTHSPTTATAPTTNDHEAHETHGTHEADEPYLPTASWWPLVIGFGAALTLNGLILSWPFAVPGAVVVALGIGGIVNDSRRRT
jgi:hypothetical protein